MKTRKIILYDEPKIPEIQIQGLAEFLEKTFSAEIEIRENIFHATDEGIFEKIAGTRIFDLKKQFERHAPSQIDIIIEKEGKNTLDEMYDGFELCRVTSEFIPRDENKMNTLHIVFTDKLVCTFDESDFRYHARALIGSNPTIISTTGIIEAPAKPKEYYLDLMTSFSQKEVNNIKEKYKGKILEHHDLRISEIIKGYLLQVIIYYETGEAFCKHADCRLYNAHWQEEIFVQLENKKFCAKHEGILNELKTS